MRDLFPHIGLGKLCGWFGLSRQAYYQHRSSAVRTTICEELILDRVKQIREKHRRMGTRKLYQKLSPFLQANQIKMGRDGLFSLLSAHHLLIRKRKRRVQTTQSFHWLRKYPNLIKDFNPRAPNQLWVSDITYWKIAIGYVYISFITDAFSHKIVGYHLARTLETVETIQALNMALADFEEQALTQLIHHSDRGVQYCSGVYVERLKQYQVQISMTEQGDPLENPVAERLNGIIKQEYLYDLEVDSFEEAQKQLDQAVRLYNEDRPHMSIDNLTPSQVHHASEHIQYKKKWKNYYQNQNYSVNLNQDLDKNVKS